MRIGFIGIGRMGEGMARNLLRAGHEVTVYNRSGQKARALESDGAKVASTPAEAARNAEAILTMVADDDALEEIVFGPGGLSDTIPEATHISHSTISLRMARRLTAEHGKRNQPFLSAPVFGRPDAAEAKRLIVCAAGETALIERFQPLFEAIGRRTFVVGSEPWQANALKLNGNFMIACMMEAFSEAFAALRKGGVDHHLFLEVMNELFASPVYKNYGGAMANESFGSGGGFALKLGFKDLRLVQECAQELEAPMPFAGVLRDQFISAIAHGQDHLDWSSLALVSARAAGLKASSKSA